MSATPFTLHCDRPTEQILLLRLAGSWKLREGIPAITAVQEQVAADPQIQCITFATEEITAWDVGLLLFVRKLMAWGTQHQITVDRTGLPEGARRLLDLATAVPEREGARRQAVQDPLLARVGKATIAWVGASMEMLGFLGEAFLAFLQFLHGRARFRRFDLTVLLQECGAQALPIVTLISFLVGGILAFIGAVQLQQFGAQIYVADLVGLAMALEMAAMMTGIIMAGRTGAAFAAQLGTMQVNQEIDALITLGISPMEFLVLPRMLALILMVPLLTVYANLLGIVGGAMVGVGMLDVSLVAYFTETQQALTLTVFAKGLIKSAIYGVLVALAGCLRGMQCGRSAAAVGDAATSAVVTGIVFIIVSSAILTVIYHVVW
jgi:phospholipid/cholesterol/gamma-HCH transport system permease protein